MFPQRLIATGVAAALMAGALAGCAPSTQGVDDDTTPIADTGQKGDAQEGKDLLYGACAGCHTPPEPGSLSPMTTDEATAFLTGHIGLITEDQVPDVLAYLQADNVND